MGIRCADHVTPLYQQKLALTSLTGDGRSVGIVRSRTKATEFFFYAMYLRNISVPALRGISDGLSKVGVPGADILNIAHANVHP